MRICKLCGKAFLEHEFYQCSDGSDMAGICKKCASAQRTARRLYKESQARRAKDYEQFNAKVTNYDDYYLLVKCGERFTEDYREVKKNERLVKRHEQAGIFHSCQA